jgi:hypothetical protein
MLFGQSRVKGKGQILADCLSIDLQTRHNQSPSAALVLYKCSQVSWLHKDGIPACFLMFAETSVRLGAAAMHFYTSCRK